jgi:hypothetical protein
MEGLPFYVNQQTASLKGVTSADSFARLLFEKKITVRDLLWKRPSLMDVRVFGCGIGMRTLNLKVTGSRAQSARTG